LPKIRRIRPMCMERGTEPVIEVDGGEHMETASEAAAAGATAFVAGSAMFGSKDYKAAIAAIRQSAAAAAAARAHDACHRDRDALKREAEAAAGAVQDGRSADLAPARPPALLSKRLPAPSAGFALCWTSAYGGAGERGGDPTYLLRRCSADRPHNRRRR
jgi:hypothetical protein